MVLLPGKAQQVTDYTRCTLRFFLNYCKRLTNGGGDIGDLSQKIGEPEYRGQWVIQVMGDTRNQLADCRHFFRLDQLVLQSAPLGLVVEQKHHRGSVGAANRNSRNSIGAVAGP